MARTPLTVYTLCTALLLTGACSNPKTGLSGETPENYRTECLRQLEILTQRFASVENYQGPHTPEAFLPVVDAMDAVLNKAWNKAGLYQNVHPDAEVRAAADRCEQEISRLFVDIELSRLYYEHLAKLDLSAADAVTQHHVKRKLRELRRAGADKDRATQDRIRKLREEIVVLGQDFGRNIREDVRRIELDSVKELEGLPEDYIRSHPPGANGKISITTDYPDSAPFMQYAHSDGRRLELYKQFRNRGYPRNDAVLKQLLKKRDELSRTLGYENFAAYVTEDKMIENPDNAQAFIDKINQIATPRAQQDYAVLLTRLRKLDPQATAVGDWQKDYLLELVKQEEYRLDSRELRQYFSYPKVRDGIFLLSERLFGIEIRPWKTRAWHESVESYEILDQGAAIGRFYLDMHPREGKYKHAAHFDILKGVKGVQIPVSALVCNFPGGDSGPAYMEHGQVEVFLHEFGHLLHAIFSGQQPWLGVSGISTEWDFVEAPSQMLEEWVWDADTLKGFAVNARGETIPDTMIEKMNAVRNLGKGLMAKHQMFYAALSLNYYRRNPDSFELPAVERELQKHYSPYAYVDDTHFYASFGHLDGYSAIYYTYMWSRVIADDMFSEFEKHGLLNAEVAGRYRRAVLAPGGSRDAADLVYDFLGRPYDFAAFEKKLNRPAVVLPVRTQ
jgi:thimet oligopeptidase